MRLPTALQVLQVLRLINIFLGTCLARLLNKRTLASGSIDHTPYGTSHASTHSHYTFHSAPEVSGRPSGWRAARRVVEAGIRGVLGGGARMKRANKMKRQKAAATHPTRRLGIPSIHK